MQIMKIKKNAFLVSIMIGCLLITGCPDGVEHIDISPERMLFGRGGESKIISVESGVSPDDIHITDSKFAPKDSERQEQIYSEELDEVTEIRREWIAVIRLEAGKYEVTVEENDSGKERFGYVLFDDSACGRGRLYITQKGK